MKTMMKIVKKVRGNNSNNNISGAKSKLYYIIIGVCGLLVCIIGVIVCLVYKNKQSIKQMIMNHAQTIERNKNSQKNFKPAGAKAKAKEDIDVGAAHTSTGIIAMVVTQPSLGEGSNDEDDDHDVVVNGEDDDHDIIVDGEIGDMTGVDTIYHE